MVSGPNLNYLPISTRQGNVGGSIPDLDPTFAKKTNCYADLEMFFRRVSFFLIISTPNQFFRSLNVHRSGWTVRGKNSDQFFHIPHQ
jgi:hypothetical protein